MRQRRTGIFKHSNEYAQQLGRLYARTPKAVLAAIAVSALTKGGDMLSEAQTLLLHEWNTLNLNGIVLQKAPRAALEGMKS